MAGGLSNGLCAFQHKGEEDDDMRILMWMLATVEEGKEVWAMGKRPEVLILEKSFF